MANRRAPSSRSGAGTARRPTKAERKQEARRQREELQRRMARRQRNRWFVVAALAVVAVTLVAVVATRPRSSPRTESPSALPGLLTGAQPWSANTADLAARLAKLNLPPVGGAFHIHAHLDVFVDGAPVQVPADIGLTQGLESPIHTHKTDGVIHMEAAAATTFRLGQFFDVWGVRFTPTCLGGYCASGDQRLQVFVNGKASTGDPTTLALQEHQEIAIAFGTAAQLPKPIPSTFDWAHASL